MTWFSDKNLWMSRNQRHETLIEFHSRTDGQVEVLMESEINGRRDMAMAFWLDQEQAQDLAKWLLKSRTSPQ